MKTFICNKTEFGWLKYGAELTEGQFMGSSMRLSWVQAPPEPSVGTGGTDPAWRGSFGSGCWSLPKLTCHQKRVHWGYLICLTIDLSKSVPVEVIKTW